jgi:transposase
MFLKQTPNKKTGKIHLSMAYTYWDKTKGYARTKTVESYGYDDELKKTYDDPVAHFTVLVDEKNRLAQEEDAEYTIVANKNLTIPISTPNRMNYGYIVLLRIYYELGLDRFLANRRRATKIEYDTNAILKLLVISRVLSPGSKKKAFEERGRYFDFDKKINFGLTEVYSSLSYFAGLAADIQLLIHDRIKKSYGRKTGMIYYDVTNYYFEVDEEDGLKAKGVSKEHRPDPIVQMGLAVDEEGIPISYEVFPGNDSEKLHLRPMVFKLLSKYETGKVIAVADAAQNTGNNVYYLDKGKQGYVFSQSIRGSGKAFKEYVTAGDGYEWFGEEYKRKSRIERREIQVDFERKDGTTYKKKVLVDQRQVVFYSEKYAERSRAKRASTLKKAQRIIDNPAAYSRATSYGALKYIKNIVEDKETGELRESQAKPCFDLDRLIEEEKYDGYYALVTNVFDEGKDRGKFGDDKIIDIYRGLWRIEDSFKVTKSDLEARPIFLSRNDRIHGHFLTCFIALVIIRLIQKRMGFRHSVEKLIDAMNKISCSNEGENLYLFDYSSDVSDDLGDAFGIDFTKLRLTRSEIKKKLGAAKKI